jgi:hypothetical protein
VIHWNGMRAFLLVVFLVSAQAQPVIQSFVASKSAITAGENVTLSWEVKGATAVTISGVGPVTPAAAGQVIVAPFGQGSATYTLTASNGAAGATAAIAIQIDDYFARVSSWPSVTRAFGFETPPQQHNYLLDPGWDPGEDQTYNNAALDLTRAVSGKASMRFITRPVCGENCSGDVHLDFSADGRTTFGPGEEFYVQWRQYMDAPYLQNVYLGGAACKARLTLTSVSGAFQAGETVVQTGGGVGTDGALNVLGWSPPMLVGTRAGEASLYPGSVIRGSKSGATATVSSTTPPAPQRTLEDCPGDNYKNSFKQFIVSAADQKPLPLADAVGYMKSCMASHLVGGLGFQNQFPELYHSCVIYQPFYPFFEGGLKGTDFLYESAVSGTAQSVVPQAGTRAPSPPFVDYTAGEWATVQLRVKIGTWRLEPPPQAVLAAEVTGGRVTACKVVDPGHGYIVAPAVGIDGTGGSGAAAHVTVDPYGRITSCVVDTPGAGYPPPAFIDGMGTYIRPVSTLAGDYHRDSTVDFWLARPGQPSVLVQSMSYYDLWNDSYPYGPDVSQAAPTPPYNYGKLWLLPHHTGRDPYAGPYPEANIWYDNVLIGKQRLPDPGVSVQPPTGLTIDCAKFPKCSLKWTRNPDSFGRYDEKGFGIQRCPGQVYDCVAGVRRFSDVAAVPAGATSWTDESARPKQVYTYRVYATGANRSAASNAVVNAPAPPAELKAVWEADGVKLTWKQQSDNGSFSIERCKGVFEYKRSDGRSAQLQTDSQCLDAPLEQGGKRSETFVAIRTVPAVAPGATLGYIDNKAVRGVRYTYRVRSFNAAGSQRIWNGSADAYTQNVLAGSDAPPELPSRGK